MLNKWTQLWTNFEPFAIDRLKKESGVRLTIRLHFYVNINNAIVVLHIQTCTISTDVHAMKNKGTVIDMCVCCWYDICVYVMLCCVVYPCRYRCSCFILIRVIILSSCMRSPIAIGLVKKWAIHSSFNFKCFYEWNSAWMLDFFRCICLKLPPEWTR